MPNHWHTLLRPQQDGDLSAFLQHLTNLHVKRWKRAHNEIGLGHLYQGRFKSFPIQTADSFHAVVRSVEHAIRCGPISSPARRNGRGPAWASCRRPARFRFRPGRCPAQPISTGICGSST